jgi:N utilization substance protein A
MCNVLEKWDGHPTFLCVYTVINYQRNKCEDIRTMKSEFALAFNEIIERSGLSKDTVLESLEAAMVSAYRRSVNASSAQNIEARIDPNSGELRVFAEKEVVESVENPLTEVEFSAAQKFDPDVDIGSVLLVDATPIDFGRVAAQTAKQVILQRLREAERDAQYDEFIEREGDMVHGTVHSITPQAVTIGLGRAEAILPRNQQIPGEHFRVRDRVRVYVLEVRKSSRGPVIVVSRSHPYMLRRLLEMEVPEINQGLVEIKAIAREAGKRAKVAVSALRDGVDPVGACVGLRGVRIQSIVRDLNDEKIDVIEWNPDPEAFIAKALSPARVSGVYLDEDLDRGKTAIVVVPEDQLSLAIGRSGVNARLGAKLTGWRIDIKSLPEAATESLKLLETDPLFADLAKSEAEIVLKVQGTLTKKAENRPIPPEEFQILSRFVDRVYRAVLMERDTARKALRSKLELIRDQIPVSAYDTALEEIGLSSRVQNLLFDAGYEAAGEVMEQLELDEDKILGLQGFGPKSMEELRACLNAYEFPEVEVVPEPEEEVAVEEIAEISEEVEREEVLVEEPLLEEEKVIVEAAEEVEEPEVIIEVEEMVPEAAVEALDEVEKVVAAEEGVEEIIPEPEVAEEEVTEPVAVELEDDLEKVFAGFAQQLGIQYEEDEDEEEGEIVFVEEEEFEPERKSKKRKKRTRVVEYDPDLDETVVRRRRKRGRAEDWEDFSS